MSNPHIAELHIVLMKPLTYKLYFQEDDDDWFEDEPQDKYWDSGLGAAGCIFIAKDTGRILLAHRSSKVLEPNTWGTWGGKVDEGETPKDAVVREIEEETGYSGRYKLSHLWTFKDPEVGFQYHNYLVLVQFEFTPQLNWESSNSKWVEWGEWPSPLHFGLKALLEHAGHTIQNVIKLIKRKHADVLDEITSHHSTDSFRRWFGNSVVKSDAGVPLVVYHGTNQPITSFSKMRRGSSTYAASAEKAFFFTDSPEVAGAYSAKAGSTLKADIVAREKTIAKFQKKIAQLELLANRTGNWKPYESAVEEYEAFELEKQPDDDIIGQNIIPVYLKIENPLIHDFESTFQNIGQINTLVELALKNGYDGVIMKNLMDPAPASTHYVVFSPRQIKSATGNAGDYNPKSSTITKEALDTPPRPPAIIQKAETNSPSTFNLTNAYILAATLWGEAADQGEEGMQAVMNVIMNRAKGNFDKAVKVVLMPKQFSMWNGISNPEKHALETVDLWRTDKRFQKCFQIVDRAFQGTLPDITGGAQLYFNPDKASPSWASKLIHTVTIGDHQFYKFPPKKAKRMIKKKVPHAIREMIENQNPNDAIVSKGMLIGDGIWRYELRSPFSVIKYRFSPQRKLFYLDNIATPDVNNRGKGYATSILETFFRLIKQYTGTLDCDTYTTSGMEKIKPLIEKFARQYRVRLVQGDNDDLNESHHSPNFERWFGDSKITDKHGNPLIVWKGMDWTDDKGNPITHIQRPSKFPSFDDVDSEGISIAGFFTSDAKVAQKFCFKSKSTAKSFYLKIENPFIIDAQGQPAGISQFGPSGKPFRDAMRSNKYDGAVILNTKDEGDIFVIKDPTQAKLTTSQFQSDDWNFTAESKETQYGSPGHHVVWGGVWSTGRIVAHIVKDMNDPRRGHSRDMGPMRWVYYQGMKTVFWHNAPDEEQKDSVMMWLNRNGYEVEHNRLHKEYYDAIASDVKANKKDEPIAEG